MNITQWYPFFWAVCGVLSQFVIFLYFVVRNEFLLIVSHRRTELRDKLHYAMSQSPKRSAA